MLYISIILFLPIELAIGSPHFFSEYSISPSVYRQDTDHIMDSLCGWNASYCQEDRTSTLALNPLWPPDKIHLRRRQGRRKWWVRLRLATTWLNEMLSLWLAAGSRVLKHGKSATYHVQATNRSSHVQSAMLLEGKIHFTRRWFSQVAVYGHFVLGFYIQALPASLPPPPVPSITRYNEQYVTALSGRWPYH